jgi:predicted kinase
MKRVVLIGPGASGKSTLAVQLGETMGLPVIELDKLFWRAGLVATPRDEWVKVQQRLVEKDQWIMDGDLGPFDAVEVRLRAADTIILLDFSLVRCAWRASGDPASVPISGSGCFAIAAKAARFSWKQSLTTQLLRIFTYFVALRW